MITELQNDFLALLKAGLWQKSCDTLSTEPDWDRIFNLAGEQTVIGIISDGIRILGAEELLQEEQASKFIESVANDAAKFYKINSLQERVCKLFKDNGIEFRIVKGSEAASNYPKPYLRTCGDIDVLLPNNDYLKARELVKPLSIGEDGDYDYAAHKGYYLEDGEVELHGTLHPDIGERIDEVLDQMQLELFAGTVNVSTFNAFYYFIHCLQHLFFEGLGLRQLADLTMLLAKHEEDIDTTYLNSRLMDAGLEYEWEVFICFAHLYLGLEPSAFPCEQTTGQIRRAAEDLWAICIKRGNMGFYSADKVTTEHFWVRKLQKLRKTAVEWRAHRHISPNIANQRLKRDLKKYFHLNEPDS